MPQPNVWLRVLRRVSKFTETNFLVPSSPTSSACSAERAASSIWKGSGSAFETTKSCSPAARASPRW